MALSPTASNYIGDDVLVQIVYYLIGSQNQQTNLTKRAIMFGRTSRHNRRCLQRVLGLTEDQYVKRVHFANYKERRIVQVRTDRSFVHFPCSSTVKDNHFNRNQVASLQYDMKYGVFCRHQTDQRTTFDILIREEIVRHRHSLWAYPSVSYLDNYIGPLCVASTQLLDPAKPITRRAEINLEKVKPRFSSYMPQRCNVYFYGLPLCGTKKELHESDLCIIRSYCQKMYGHNLEITDYWSSPLIPFQ